MQLSRVAIVVALLAHVAWADEEIEDQADTSPPATGAARVGMYRDSDQTTVWRVLGTLNKTWDEWSLGATFGVDAVSSASVDVRSSPTLGMVDVISTASASSVTGGQINDTRYQGTVNGGWKDGSGRAASATASAASENDYASISGGVNGSLDILERSTTLLGGITVTDNWVSSMIDPELHHKMFAVGWSAGVARVLTPSDAIRVRYDGRFADGYQASPYRYVRFGDWTSSQDAFGQITFKNTIGSDGGYAERLPELRTSHALTFEWVHSLAPGVGLHPSLRLGHDDWGISSATPAIDLRVARSDWRLQAGYRFYAQTHASFFESKYMQDPSMYAYYTSDKELGRQLGHLVELQFATVITDDDGPNTLKTWWFVRADGMRYSYPGFLLLGSRVSAFLETGFSWEL